MSALESASDGVDDLRGPNGFHEKIMGAAAKRANRGFERPYGWAWLLMLAAELNRHTTDEGKAWAAALTPLAAIPLVPARDKHSP